MTPAITRIGEPTEKMAQLVTKILFNYIQSGERIPSLIELTPKLIQRESVRKF